MFYVRTGIVGEHPCRIINSSTVRRVNFYENSVPPKEDTNSRLFGDAPSKSCTPRKYKLITYTQQYVTHGIGECASSREHKLI